MCFVVIGKKHCRIAGLRSINRESVCWKRGWQDAKGGSTTIAYMYGRRVKTLVLFVAHIKYCLALRPGGGGGGGVRAPVSKCTMHDCEVLPDSNYFSSIV